MAIQAWAGGEEQKAKKAAPLRKKREELQAGAPQAAELRERAYPEN